MSEIELTAVDGHVLSAYRADPSGEALGGVVVIQEIFGVNDHIRSVVDRVAAAGFVAVAPALFDRVQRGAAFGYDEAGTKAGVDLAWNLPIDQALDDLTAATDALARDLGGAAHVGSIGFCYGGMLSAALSSRRAHHLGASVAYYPSMASQILMKDQPHIPLMVHLGDLDARVTVADGELLRTRWPDAEFHRYPAGHGFNCELRPDFDQASSDLAWERTVGFLTAQLGEEV